MSFSIETLSDLERKMHIALPKATFQQEVQSRLGRIAKQVRIDGFRPGKVPKSVVEKRYGSGVYAEVLEEQVQKVFSREVTEQKIRVAGISAMQPAHAEEPNAPANADQLNFEVLFEVFPEVTAPDLANLEVVRYTCALDEEAVERTLLVLRRQHASYGERAADEGVVESDRVTLDFEGKVDGETFEGGKAEDFTFQTGQKQMLPEFEAAVLGMKVGQSKAFPLSFPENYHGKEVAGKTADFMLTVKKIEAEQLPALDDAFAASLGADVTTVDQLRKSIRDNVAREVKARLASRNKGEVFGKLGQTADLAIPKVLVQQEVQAMVDRMFPNNAREKMSAEQRQQLMGFYQQNLAIPAEQRVRSSLLFNAIVESHGLKPESSQVTKYIEEMASSFEDPLEVIKHVGADKQKVAEIESVVLENNVLEHVYSKAKVTEQTLPFEELLSQRQ